MFLANVPISLAASDVSRVNHFRFRFFSYFTVLQKQED